MEFSAVRSTVVTEDSYKNITVKEVANQTLSDKFAKAKEYDKRGVWIVGDEDSLDTVLSYMRDGAREFETWNQKEVDDLVISVSKHLEAYHTQLATTDYEETKCGNIRDKLIKNNYANSTVTSMYAQTRTVGEVTNDTKGGVKHYAHPMGVIAACVPFTNASATTLFKAILCLKTRNVVLFSPTPNCTRTVYDTCALLCDAIKIAGGPPGLVGVLQPKKGCKLLQPMLDHPGIDFIFATGGRNMVQKAYSSGKPALGVGAGNVPVIIDSQANIREALEYVSLSKTFDNGMLCMSEDVLIVHESIYEELVELMEMPGSKYHVLDSPDDIKKINDVLRGKEGLNNFKVIGKNAKIVAAEAGVEISSSAEVIVGAFDCVDRNNNWMWEKMCPVLGLIKYHTEEEAFDYALSILKNDGMGHSVIIHTNHYLKNKSLGIDLEKAAHAFPVGRITVNQPGCFGTIGGLMNFGIPATMSIGCGTWGGNSSSDNIGPRHLLNFKTVAKRATELNCVRKIVPQLRDPKLMVRSAIEVWCVCLEVLHADETSEYSIIRDAEALSNVMDYFRKTHDFLNIITNDPMQLFDVETTNSFARVLDGYHKDRNHLRGREVRLHCDEIRAISCIINISFGYLLFLMFPLILRKNPYLPPWDGVSKIVDVDIGRNGDEIAKLVEEWRNKILKYPQILEGAVPNPNTRYAGLDRAHIRRIKYAERHLKLCELLLSDVIDPRLVERSFSNSTMSLTSTDCMASSNTIGV